MAEDIRMWEIIKGKDMKRIEKLPFGAKHYEEDLEDWLEKDITLISEDLLVIGRQVGTYKPNADIDLLCLDGNGDTVIIELKRGETHRVVTAQTLDYASWIKDLSYDDICERANNYLNEKHQKSLEKIFSEKFEKPLPEELNVGHRMLIVASDLDEETERIIKYLSEEYGVPINFVKFQYFSNDKQEFLARVFLLDPVETEQRATKTIRSKRKIVKLRNPLELFDKNIIKEDDVFFFIDNEGKTYEDVECHILKKKGKANAFYVRINKIQDYKSIDIPTEYTGDSIIYTAKDLPIEETANACSIALHQLLLYKGKKITRKEHSKFTIANFVRKSDKINLEGLWELCKEI